MRTNPKNSVNHCTPEGRRNSVNPKNSVGENPLALSLINLISEYPFFLRAREHFYGQLSDGKKLINFGSPYGWALRGCGNKDKLFGEILYKVEKKSYEKSSKPDRRGFDHTFREKY